MTARRQPRARPSRRPEPAPAAGRVTGGRAVTLLLVLTLAAATAWAYRTSFTGAFVFDDIWAIVENPNIRSLWPITSAMSAPPE